MGLLSPIVGYKAARYSEHLMRGKAKAYAPLYQMLQGRISLRSNSLNWHIERAVPLNAWCGSQASASRRLPTRSSKKNMANELIYRHALMDTVLSNTSEEFRDGRLQPPCFNHGHEIERVGGNENNLSMLAAALSRL
jgi:hypothetical protein